MKQSDPLSLYARFICRLNFVSADIVVRRSFTGELLRKAAECFFSFSASRPPPPSSFSFLSSPMLAQLSRLSFISQDTVRLFTRASPSGMLLLEAPKCIFVSYLAPGSLALSKGESPPRSLNPLSKLAARLRAPARTRI